MMAREEVERILQEIECHQLEAVAGESDRPASPGCRCERRGPRKETTQCRCGGADLDTTAQ